MVDDRIQTVRRRNEESRSDCILQTVKFSTKAMVWGANSINGTSKLLIVQGSKNYKKVHRGATFTFEATDPLMVWR